MKKVALLFVFLGIAFSEYSFASTGKNNTGFRFEIFQQEFLSKNLKYFKYFEHLLAGKSPKEIQEKNKLSQEVTDKYLGKLVELKLIQVDSNKKVTFFQQGKTFTTWSGNDPMGLLYNNHLLDDLVKRSKASGPSHYDVNSELFSLNLSEQEAQQFHKDFNKLVLKYRKLTHKKASSNKTFSGALLFGEDKNNFFPEVDNNI